MSLSSWLQTRGRESLLSIPMRFYYIGASALGLASRLLGARAPFFLFKWQLAWTRRWSQSSSRKQLASFELWSLQSDFPKPGWAARGYASIGPNFEPPVPHILNACLSSPLLPWSCPDEDSRSDIETLLSFKARQIAHSELSSLGALHVLETIPKSSVYFEAFFRDALTEIDPLWHARGFPDDTLGRRLQLLQDQTGHELARLELSEIARRERLDLARTAKASPSRASGPSKRL